MALLAARGKLHRTGSGFSGVDNAAHGVPVKACHLKLAHDHADVRLAQFLSRAFYETALIGPVIERDGHDGPAT